MSQKVNITLYGKVFRKNDIWNETLKLRIKKNNLAQSTCAQTICAVWMFV